MGPRRMGTCAQGPRAQGSRPLVFGSPQGIVDFMEMSNVAADVAADVVAFLAALTSDVFAADTADVLSAAKAVNDGSFAGKNNVHDSGFPRQAS